MRLLKRWGWLPFAIGFNLTWAIGMAGVAHTFGMLVFLLWAASLLVMVVAMTWWTDR